MNPKNPLYILELDHNATPGDIEREGRKLLALLDVGAAKARSYTCPLGVFPRDATMVREAMAALRDPVTRAKFGCLVALLAAAVGDDNEEDNDVQPDAPLEDAFLAGGYRGL